MHDDIYQNPEITPVRVTLEWEGYWGLSNIPRDLSEFHERLREITTNYNRFYNRGFYAFFVETQLEPDSLHISHISEMGILLPVYIGHTYDQTMSERIPQNHDAYDDCIVRNYNGRRLYWAVANVSHLSGIEEITRELHHDIECCLILTNNPVCNENCEDGYNPMLGREIEIENIGAFGLLQRHSRCQ